MSLAAVFSRLDLFGAGLGSGGGDPFAAQRGAFPSGTLLGRGVAGPQPAGVGSDPRGLPAGVLGGGGAGGNLGMSGLQGQAILQDISQLGQGLMLDAQRIFQPLSWRGPAPRASDINVNALRFVSPGTPVRFGGVRILG